jgi:hypothetical protein
MGWLIAFGILFLLAILPLGASVKYNADGPLIRIIGGPIRLTVFPRKKKDKKENKPKKEKKKKKNKEEDAPSEEEKSKKKTVAGEEAPEEEKKGGSVLDFLPLVRVGINFLGDFRRKLRVNRLDLKLIMAGDDPCDLATNYGRIWEAIGNLFPLLERAFVIKKRDIEVECDFEASETVISARLDITITLGRIISLAVRYAVRALIEFIKIKNKRKGGASNEQDHS